MNLLTDPRDAMHPDWRKGSNQEQRQALEELLFPATKAKGNLHLPSFLPGSSLPLSMLAFLLLLPTVCWLGATVKLLNLRYSDGDDKNGFHPG